MVETKVSCDEAISKLRLQPKRVLVLPGINSLAHTDNTIVVLKQQQERDSVARAKRYYNLIEPISTGRLSLRSPQYRLVQPQHFLLSAHTHQS